MPDKEPLSLRILSYVQSFFLLCFVCVLSGIFVEEVCSSAPPADGPPTPKQLEQMFWVQRDEDRVEISVYRGAQGKLYRLIEFAGGRVSPIVQEVEKVPLTIEVYEVVRK